MSSYFLFIEADHTDCWNVTQLKNSTLKYLFGFSFPYTYSMSQPTKLGRILGFTLFVGNTVWGRRFLFSFYFVLSCSGDNVCLVSEAATDITTPVQHVSRSIHLVSLLSCFLLLPNNKHCVVRVQSKKSQLVHYNAVDNLSVLADKPGHLGAQQ